MPKHVPAMKPLMTALINYAARNASRQKYSGNNERVRRYIRREPFVPARRQNAIKSIAHASLQA